MNAILRAVSRRQRFANALSDYCLPVPSDRPVLTREIPNPRADMFRHFCRFPFRGDFEQLKRTCFMKVNHCVELVCETRPEIVINGQNDLLHPLCSFWTLKLG